MGPVHMNEVQCSGFEKSVTECSFNRESLGCSHEEDAAVRCNVPAMGFQDSVRPSPLACFHCALEGHCYISALIVKTKTRKHFLKVNMESGCG